MNGEENIDRPGAKILAVAGLILYSGPVWGMLGTIVGMIRAFNTLEAEAMGDPEALSNDISFALVTTVIGLGVGLIGAILTAISMFGMNFRRRWFLNNVLGLSIFWCFTGAGILIGLPLLIAVFMRKKRDVAFAH